MGFGHDLMPTTNNLMAEMLLRKGHTTKRKEWERNTPKIFGGCRNDDKKERKEKIKHRLFVATHILFTRGPFKFGSSRRLQVATAIHQSATAEAAALQMATPFIIVNYNQPPIIFPSGHHRDDSRLFCWTFSPCWEFVGNYKSDKHWSHL